MCQQFLYGFPLVIPKTKRPPPPPPHQGAQQPPAGASAYPTEDQQSDAHGLPPRPARPNNGPQSRPWRRRTHNNPCSVRTNTSVFDLAQVFSETPSEHPENPSDVNMNEDSTKSKSN